VAVTTPWGLAHKIGLFYEKYRRIKVDGRYRAFNRTGPEDASRNWPHYMRAAEVIWNHKTESHEEDKNRRIDPEEYIAAQFIGATKAVYPRPNNLYSKRAMKNWMAVNFMPRVRDTWEHNNMYLGIFMRRWNLTASEVVINPYWDWFAPWFRVVFLKEEDLCLYADEALQSLKSRSVRNLLEEVGEDVGELERRLHKAKETLT